MFARLKIASLVTLFGVLITLGFLAAAVAGVSAIAELKVGGPLYQRIVLGKDLVADILPPPEYIIESYLEATLALNDPASVTARRSRLAQLRKEYDERHAYWEARQPGEMDLSVRDMLTRTSHTPVSRFWTELDARFLPALERGDLTAAKAAYGVLAQAYNDHRAVVDSIVKATETMNADTERYADQRDSLFLGILWSVAGVVLVLLVGGIIGIARGVIRPVVGMTAVMTRLADGDLSIIVPSTGRADEVGDMAQAVQVFHANAIETERLRAEQENQRRQAEQERLTSLRTMAETVEREARTAVEGVATQTGRMAENAQKMARSADAVTHNSQSVAAAAHQALTNAQTVASASEELNASIREIASQVGAANGVTRDAVAASDRAQATIAQLAGAVNRISEVAGLINSIAGQTNLLALNATIEAARAGEAGKGFAVVATEVKNLAAQTAKATEEIGQQITEIQSTTDGAVQAVTDIAGAIRNIEGLSGMIAAAIEEQGAATNEIARNVAQTSDAAREVAARIAGVSDEANATGARAAEVSSLSGAVSDSIDALRTVLIRVVRTATKDVDRRVTPRYALNRSATLILGGQPHTVSVEDFSEGGALLLNGPASARDGTRGELRVDGLAPALPLAVRSIEHGRIHVQFDLTPEQAVRFADQFARLVKGLPRKGYAA
ncbi:methyl-accepting chemotaxis protein [Azospirillum fermentarium]|uniref:methyl-accepting chemotaxis protein n=1 Tax=Azospirillum fermentarium TaxID=1233114 RepID=UPI00222721E4|nr:methyl-accepting chemotaxis protein [Azospirillum fermentarium]MCW2247647.1 methyl-accepting chemotaxis protein [Azospirillum fermentarium]